MVSAREPARKDRDRRAARADGRAAGVSLRRRVARGARDGRRDARRRIRASRCSSSSAIAAYLALESFGAWLRARRARARSAGSPGFVLALLIAVGIGLHNFGEGLAIGAAFALGEAALGTLLMIGFTLHNTTEGLAIVAPIAKDRPSIWTLARLGTHRRAADDCRRLGRRPALFAGARRGVPRPRCRRDRAGRASDRASDRRRALAVGAVCDGARDGWAPRGFWRHVRHGVTGRMTTHFPVRTALLVVAAIGALALVPIVARDALTARRTRLR